MTLEEQIKELEGFHNAQSSLSHANNILGKKTGEASLSNQQKNALNLLIPEYHKYISAQLKITGYSEAEIKARVSLLNDYYTFYYGHVGNTFSAQSKLRPTIIEEFLYLLFKDLIADLEKKEKINAGNIKCGATKAYVNMYFTGMNLKSFFTNIDVRINTKDQDFAIYRELTLSTGDKQSYELSIPVLAAECKTFVDKTMLEGVIATAEKIKNGNPYSRFIVVAETWDVAKKVDPAYSRIDQIYILRKCSRRKNQDISDDVVIALFNETRAHLESPWSDTTSKLKNTGKII